MKIVYKNNFGKFMNLDFTVTEVLAEVSDNEHTIALEQGFVFRQGVWRQCRSVRIRLEETNYSLLPDAKILTDYDYDQLMFINTKYLKKRNYSFNAHDVEINGNHIIWGYYNKNKLIAWSKIYQYNGELESVYFSWDSSDMELKLGISSLYHEIAWAKSLGYKYLYIGPGYEVCSKYKSQVDGFEFWDGMCWNKDIKSYLVMCDKETSVNSFKSYQNLIYNAS